MLDAAFNAFIGQQGRWAYTETHSGLGTGGKPKAETVVRVDPSQPYARQRVPLKLSGKPPTEKQLSQWAEQQEQAAKRRQARPPVAPLDAPGGEEFQLPILNQLVVPELGRATVLAEDATAVTYDVPLHKVGDTTAKPFDAFQLTARVNRQHRQFERVTIRQRATVRIAGGKFSDGLTEVEFGSPDPRYPAVPVKRTSRTTNKPLFGQANTTEDTAVRTDLKHVTPYDEQFGVKIGPLRTLQF
ncbi:MAG: hypothetical protein NTV51_26540 [Verrucomicrobia bacterium]|nr:hypothetical protein [Verrucomicrobiota bacterium]